MRIHALVYPALALLASWPGAAGAMGFGNPPSVSAPTLSSPIVERAIVRIQCSAQDSTSVRTISASVSGGTLANGLAQEDLAITPGASVSGSTSWVAPAAGPATVTCTATNAGGQSASASSSVTVLAASTVSVVIDSITGPTAPMRVGTAARLEAVAHDPAGGALTYAWSASAGSIQAAGSAATLTAPDVAGPVTVTLTVASASGSAPATGTVGALVVLTDVQGSLGDPLPGPHRLALAPEGFLYVVDGGGGFHSLTARGESRGNVVLPDRALAVAAGPGVAFVSTVHGKILRVDAASGKAAGSIDVGYALGPMGMVFDGETGLLWLAERDAAQLRAIRLDGTTAMTIGSAGGHVLNGAMDVALDRASGLVWVAVEYNPGGPIAHAFRLGDGSHARSVLVGGTGLDQVTRAGGIAVDTVGRVFVSDAYAGRVQVASGEGGYLGALGSFGAGRGELRQPAGVLALPNGDVLVASSDSGRIERYGSTPALPVCAGDSDCDGLPDAWEIARGLDPRWAGDALMDYDADGLTSAQEYALGTDPRDPDTDGDGYSDGDELLAGFDPRDPGDHRPAVEASGPGETAPGLVKLSATVSGPGTCRPAWSVAAAPAPVALSAADSLAPTFIARTPGRYELEAVAVCGVARSAPARVKVAVRNVPPIADAGRVVVTTGSKPLRLDALFSTDANGDALTYGWDQTLGPPVAGAQAGGVLTAKPRGNGLYSFVVTAKDVAGATSTAEVPVLVAAGPVSTAVAAAFPAEAEVGARIELDATSSLVTDDEVTFAWTQLDGPKPVLLAGADRPVASFVPEAAGRYAFAVTVGAGRLRSPPARVDVFVAEAGRALPAIASAAAEASVVGVNTSVPLTAAGSGTGYVWRQIAGPASGLTDADRATALAVPFSPGFHVFEVQATDGGAVSRPVRVAFEARASGKAIPAARAAAIGTDFVEGQLVFLDGRGSTGAARFRWTQVAGPWVALSAQSAVTTFRAHSPGLYAFELEVDDGRVRSAPARVEVNVAAERGNGP